MTSKPKSRPAPAHANPIFVDVVADGTHQGKSLLAARIRDHLEDAGIPTTLVRIESRQLAKQMRPDDIFVATEDLTRAQELPGGVVGVLKPGFALFDAIAESKGALVFDWAGGLGAHRLGAFASMRVDHMLKKRGIKGYSVVVTTNNVDRIEEAARSLEDTARIAPGLLRILALNRKTGDFSFPADSRAARSVAALLAIHAEGAIMHIPSIDGDALAHFAPLGLEMKEIISRDADALASELQSDDFIVTACQTHIAAWYSRTRKELGAVPFRCETRAD